ncbi:hypothetical protein GJ744_006716 [Endocarpon pusillum]|uniref:Uncharacterized protein n=1 Tax=Endocarpon pusillum TaxID=364733 RepID=A0A8H7ALV5_9EURO|nr:hypothetical protein GJ744_006716 [Endocarpon pusillum]
MEPLSRLLSRWMARWPITQNNISSKAPLGRGTRKEAKLSRGSSQESKKHKTVKAKQSEESNR